MYGSEVLRIWLNCLLTLEEVPSCMKDSLVFPVYKWQRLLVNAIIKDHSPPVTVDTPEGFHDQLQTVYQKRTSCMDTIFTTHVSSLGCPILTLKKALLQ